MTRDEKGTSYGGEEHIKIMEHIFEYMTKNILNGLKFLYIYPTLDKIYLS